MGDGRRILVTGGTGFFGGAVVPAALETGAEVSVTTSGAPPDDEPWHREVTWHRVDLFDPVAAAAVVDAVGPTDLLHLAWHLVPGSYDDVDNVRWVRASLGLLEAVDRAGARRAVLVGSGSEYDPAYGLCTEATTPLAPRTTYGRAKAALGQMVESFAAASSTSCAWARVFNAYGPGEDRRRLVASVACSLLRGQVASTSAGSQVRDFLHVRDVAEGLLALLDSDVRGAVNIASGDPVRVLQLVEGVADVLDAHNLLDVGALPIHPADPPLLVADVRRAADEVGWRARIGLEEGLRSTVAWWRARLSAAPREIDLAAADLTAADRGGA